jgi:FPC/CPF motif-containing protein YcgG
MRIYSFIILLALIAIGGKLQAQNHIEEMYDKLTEEWLQASKGLKSYAGLGDFCTHVEQRKKILDILHQLHHYDSLVLEILLKHEHELDGSHKEHLKTLKDIEKFEHKFTARGFIGFLRESCVTRADLEKNKTILQKEVGTNSYDGQIHILETHLIKFLKHIDHRVLAIDHHIHKIHPDHVLTKEQLADR